MEKITYKEVRERLSFIRQRIIETIKSQLEEGKNYEISDDLTYTEAVDTGLTNDWGLEYFDLAGIYLIDAETMQDRFDKWQEVNDYWLQTILESIEQEGLIAYGNSI